MLSYFIEVAEKCADRPAIVHNGRPLSYAQLVAQAWTVADRLGPDPGVIGVFATHTPGTIAALWGVWAAGGTYCPIDPAFPAARQLAMREAAGCASLLAVEAFDVGPISAAEPPQRADDAAYILFTSGSTGSPKPVVTSHRAIATTVGSLRNLFDLTPDDRVLQFASLNWDTCFEEILPTLTSGASLVMGDEAHTGSFPRLLRMVELEGVTVLNLPTAFWHELVNHLLEEGTDLPGSVRLVIIGGEAVRPARLADWSNLDTGQIRLLNTYGCTETTLITHAIDLDGPAAAIGRALPHVVERITEEGELLIGGPSVATGYRGLPEASAARFVTLPDGRFFRTGDRVSRRHDGALVHEGRIDDELKIRGIRVDPGEVEAQIAAHPAVSAVAVAGIAVADHTALAAYIVARPLATTEGLEADILRYLRAKVPAHLVPGRILLVPELVYTASGKVDRRRLKEVYA